MQPWARAELASRRRPERGYDDPTAHCFVAGVPRSMYVPSPVQIVQPPGYVVFLFERMSWRTVPLDGRPHLPDAIRLWQGDSVGRWEGDTLVVDTIAIDTRMRNISVGRTGDANAWLHSEKEHVIERFSRPSKNYLMYQLTVEDPVVLTKPFTSAPHVWTLAQDPNDVWTEYICTANEEPEVYKNLDSQTKQDYERSGRDGTAPAGRGDRQ